MTMILFLCGVAAYLAGSIPFGLILTRMAGLGDIRKVGSGNIGATNVLRTGNKELAALTLILDGAKGAAVVLLARAFSEIFAPNRANMSCPPNVSCGYSTTEIELVIFVLGALAIIGHMYPVWLKFKGGKGVATFFGLMLAYAPFVGLGCLATWLVAAAIGKRSSVAALTATLLAPVYLFALFFNELMKRSLHSQAVDGPPIDAMPVAQVEVIGLCALLVALIWWRHLENIKRVLNGTEPKIGKKAA